MTDQEQNVGRGATGYQASRDVVVHQGMSSEQMAEIMVALSRQLGQFIADAREAQEQRFKEFRDSLLEEFAKPENENGRSAFAEPDFQYVVRDAHETFARSGDADLKDRLVKLVAERSTKTSDSRVAKILNSAIEIAGRLSDEDYASLIAMFLATSAVVMIPNQQYILNQYSERLNRIVDDLPTSSSSMEYLATLGCVNINYVITQTLGQILTNKYGHALGPGFSDKEFIEKVGDRKIPPLPSTLFRKAEGVLCFRAGSEGDIRLELEKTISDGQLVNDLMSLRAKTIPEQQVLEVFRTGVSRFGDLEKFWTSAGADKSHLTLIGKALAHSALTSKGALSAPIEIWVS